jgi:hypothetical protein
MLQHMHDEQAVKHILAQYEIMLDLAHKELIHRTEQMCGDAILKIPNYATVKIPFKEERHDSTFLYRFDQLSRINNHFEGTAYHAHELLYLF